MSKIDEIQTVLRKSITRTSQQQAVFFKTGPGQYAEHDRFLGIPTPILRKIAKKFSYIPFDDIRLLLGSAFNEERLLGLFILVGQYAENPDAIYQFYLANLRQVNNWNLVDASAHFILGKYLSERDKSPLFDLVPSPILWERRVAIVATWYFIKNADCQWTYKIGKLLLNDSHDLIHKAVGWMLREAGKQDQIQLINFLDRYRSNMPRTMLRYAIEKLSKEQRLRYMGE